MGKTSIEWTRGDDGTKGDTWNPVRGCSRVSAGCENCYAMGIAYRFSGPGKPFEGLAQLRKGKPDWTGKVRLVPDMLSVPLRWRKPRRVFVNSMSDLFHPALSNEEIAAVFGVMAACPQHTFQILTKRPERAREWFKWIDSIAGDHDSLGHGDARATACIVLAQRASPDTMLRTSGSAAPWSIPNVWLGTSVENQKAADRRIPWLLECPASVRFVSMEPLLESTDLTRVVHWVDGYTDDEVSQLLVPEEPVRINALTGSSRDGEDMFRVEYNEHPRLDWVIVGGESGNGARPCQVEWIRSILDQCRDAGVACFIKQDFGTRPGMQGRIPDDIWRVKEFPL